jgi:nucleotide-binding universal stress UspA family protein
MRFCGVANKVNGLELTELTLRRSRKGGAPKFVGWGSDTPSIQHEPLGLPRALLVCVNILTATDGSAKGSTALHTAARVLGRDYRNFTLLCVAASYPKLRRGGRRRQEYERGILSEITQILADAKADLTLSEAERGQYDLVVLGAIGTRGLRHTMLASVSAKVAWSASWSVLMVREPH